MKRVFTAKPVLAGCGTKKKNISSSERVDISEIGNKLKEKAKYITIDKKYLDQVCDILDNADVYYTVDSYDRKTNTFEFHIIYE